MPLTHDQVLQYVREHGPSVPNEIRQALQAQDNMIVGAVLSELVGSGKLAMSDLSLGTSKFYYDPQTPEMLEKASQYLNEKDIRTYQQLRAEKVLRNSDVTPLLRLSLANIKDYSRPLRVRKDDGSEELFWHYYLISPEEAFELIKHRYFNLPKETKQEAKEPKQEVKQEAKAETRTEKEPKEKPKRKKAEQQTLPAAQPESQPTATLAGDFPQQVHSYFEQKGISVLQVLLNKKNELSLIVSMNTPVGSVKYFCKAKSKKTTNEGDLAAAHLEAQQHKLPLLYVAGGKLTRKASDALPQLSGAVVVQPWA